jgi:uncharacterized membrane protein SpoIIM required for sporulation
MKTDKTVGIFLMIAGGTLGLWIFMGLTSFAGKTQDWSPPFSEYEITTLIASGIAILFVVAGIIALEKKQP